jgi:hypothetical protein
MSFRAETRMGKRLRATLDTFERHVRLQFLSYDVPSDGLLGASVQFGPSIGILLGA